MSPQTGVKTCVTAFTTTTGSHSATDGVFSGGFTGRSGLSIFEDNVSPDAHQLLPSVCAELPVPAVPPLPRTQPPSTQPQRPAAPPTSTGGRHFRRGAAVLHPATLQTIRAEGSTGLRRFPESAVQSGSGRG